MGSQLDLGNPRGSVMDGRCTNNITSEAEADQRNDADQKLIRELLENWVLWRDAGDWDRFRDVWHPDGRMMATWFQGTFSEFIRVSKEGWDKGVSILHFLGGTTINICGKRAISQTKMTISQRGLVDGIMCDVVCTGRFYDFLEKYHSSTDGHSEGKWGIVLRQPIYEKDRIDPLDPMARLELDHKRLEEFPEGYRYLAYIQTKIGYEVKRDMPGLRGAEVENLYSEGRAWLANGDVSMK
jgi:hypothetical protein